MSDYIKEEVTPDELMEQFRGRSLFSIVAFTVVIHAVLLIGTSVPFLAKKVLGAQDSSISKEERIENAVREATASLRAIADEHGLQPQDISSQFGSGPKRTGGTAKGKGKGSKGGGAKAEAPVTPTATDPESPATPEKPKNAIEKELEVKGKGPALPSIPGDDEEDLFK